MTVLDFRGSTRILHRNLINEVLSGQRNASHFVSFLRKAANSVSLLRFLDGVVEIFGFQIQNWNCVFLTSNANVFLVRVGILIFSHFQYIFLEGNTLVSGVYKVQRLVVDDDLFALHYENGIPCVANRLHTS